MDAPQPAGHSVPERRKGLSTGCIVGIVLAAVGAVLLGIVAIVAAIAVPNLLGARLVANEAEAQRSMKWIHSANALFSQGDLDGDGSFNFAASLRELEAQGLIDNVLGTGTKSGYVFSYRTIPREGVLKRQGGWECLAVPYRPGDSGRRTFYCDDSGAIRAEQTGQAGPESPLLEQISDLSAP